MAEATPRNCPRGESRSDISTSLIITLATERGPMTSPDRIHSRTSASEVTRLTMESHKYCKLLQKAPCRPPLTPALLDGLLCALLFAQQLDFNFLA